MSGDSDTYTSYWKSVDLAVLCAVESVDEREQEEGEALHEAADGAYWVIYTHAAALTMQYSDNSDAFWESMGGDCVTGECWSEIVCKLAAWAHMADVRDRYERFRKEERA